MDDWFCMSQESLPEGENARRFRKSGYGWSVSPVPLRPEDFPYGRLRPPSRLKMNSRCSALTAVLAGLTETDIRAKGDCEGSRFALNRKAPPPGAGKSPFSLDKDLSWMPHIRNGAERVTGAKSVIRTLDLYSVPGTIELNSDTAQLSPSTPVTTTAAVRRSHGVFVKVKMVAAAPTEHPG